MLKKDKLESNEILSSFSVHGGDGGELLECCPLPMQGGIPRFACNVLETGNVETGTPFSDMPRRRIDPEINVTGGQMQPSLVKSSGMPGPPLRRPFCSNKRFDGETECTVYRTREFKNVMDCIPVK
jgi:hypothetical protein